MTQPPNQLRMSARAKALVDFGPLIVFFVVYFFGARIASLLGAFTGADLVIAEGRELFYAIGVSFPAFLAAFAYSVWRERRVAPMLLVTFILVTVLGGLTIFLNNRAFFYMRPTIANGLFSVTLAAGLMTGRNFLKLAFDGAVNLSDQAWRVLTKRYAWFFATIALTNEVVWRWLMRDCDVAGVAACAGEPLWVNIKLFGFTSANILFAAAQTPFIFRNVQEASANVPADEPAGGVATIEGRRTAPKSGPDADSSQGQ